MLTLKEGSLFSPNSFTELPQTGLKCAPIRKDYFQRALLFQVTITQQCLVI